MRLELHCSRLVTFGLEPFRLHVEDPCILLLLLNPPLKYLELGLQLKYHPCLLKVILYNFLITAYFPRRSLSIGPTTKAPPPTKGLRV